MRNMGFLLSMLTFAMIAQNMQTVSAPPGCTDVTVTYTPGGPPTTSYRQISAWKVTRCGQTVPDYHLDFSEQEKTYTLKQGQTLLLETGDTGNPCEIKTPITGPQINVECKYDHGICQKCTLK